MKSKSKKKIYDVVYVGAGPATIFGLLKYWKSSDNILVLERGEPLPERTHLLFGFAGAGCFSDSKLVCDGRIKKFLSSEQFDAYAEEILQYYREFSGDDSLSWKVPPNRKSPSSKLYFISSKVCHVGTDRSRTTFKRIQDKLSPIIRFRKKVVSVKENPWGFTIKTSDGERFLARHLVLATGSRDFLLPKISTYFRLRSQVPYVQIGVRVETSFDFISRKLCSLVEDFYDFKVAMNTFRPTARWRTFCVNAKNAFVVVEDEGEYVSANGHAYHSDKNNNMINFGILGEIHWALPLHLQIFIARKVNKQGKLLAQNIDDFLNREPSSSLEVPSTVPEHRYYLGNLWECFPPEVCVGLRDFLTEFLKHFPFKGHFFAPEINLVHPVVDCNNKLEVYPNLFVIGDVMITRSIVDAGVSGMVVARELQNRGIWR